MVLSQRPRICRGGRVALKKLKIKNYIFGADYQVFFHEPRLPFEPTVITVNPRKKALQQSVRSKHSKPSFRAGEW